MALLTANSTNVYKTYFLRKSNISTVNSVKYISKYVPILTSLPTTNPVHSGTNKQHFVG